MRVHLIQALWVYLLLTLARPPEILGQSEEGSLNFCDIGCVKNVYRHYCGEAKCTTGASDYGQIFTLCTERCAAAVAGEAMQECLTTTEPNRSDWDEVQESVLQEIVSFCTGYEIAVDPNLTPLSLKDTEKEFLDVLFDDPEGAAEPSGKKKKKSKKTKSKKRKNKRSKKDKENEAEEESRKDKDKKKEKDEESKKGKGKDTDRKKAKKEDPPPTVPTGSTRKRNRQSTKQNKKEKERNPPGSKEQSSEVISLSDDENEAEVGAMGSVGDMDKDVDMEESFDSEFDKSSAN